MSNAAARVLFTTATRHLLSLGLLLLALASAAAAQTTTTSATDGSTPLALRPGAPAGSYPLSGLDVINLYNGNLSLQVPLHQVVGRGGAQVPMMMVIEAKRWKVKHVETTDSNGRPVDSYSPSPIYSDNGVLAQAYTPGGLIARQSGI